MMAKVKSGVCRASDWETLTLECPGRLGPQPQP